MGRHNPWALDGGPLGGYSRGAISPADECRVPFVELLHDAGVFKLRRKVRSNNDWSVSGK
jgi:hypothetical protein